MSDVGIVVVAEAESVVCCDDVVDGIVAEEVGGSGFVVAAAAADGVAVVDVAHMHRIHLRRPSYRHPFRSSECSAVSTGCCSHSI